LSGPCLVSPGRCRAVVRSVAERTLTAEAQPATGHVIRYIRGLLELARGRDADALAALRAAEPLARRLATPHYTVPRARALLVHVLVRLGDTEGAEQALAELGSQDRDHGETRIATAVLRLAQDDPRAAVAALAPVLDGGPSVLPWIGLAHAGNGAGRKLKQEWPIF
jgi:LuxR family maltose regulon positive regulatory protein